MKSYCLLLYFIFTKHLLQAEVNFKLFLEKNVTNGGTSVFHWFQYNSILLGRDEPSFFQVL